MLNPKEILVKYDAKKVLENFNMRIEVSQDISAAFASQLSTKHLRNTPKDNLSKVDTVLSGDTELHQHFNELLNEEYQKVDMRLKMYISEYARLNNYKIVSLDANAVEDSQTLDVTTQIINFINQKYEGF